MHYQTIHNFYSPHKVVVETQKSGSEYDDMVIDAGSRVNADMFFDPQKSHIYVMTQRKVLYRDPSSFLSSSCECNLKSHIMCRYPKC